MTGNHLFQRLRKKWRFVAIALAAATISFIVGTLLPGNQQGSDKPATAAVQNLKQSLTVNRLAKEVGEDRTGFNLDRTIEELLTVLESKEKNLTFVPPEQFQGKTVFEGTIKYSQKVIALTVDDGPWPETTEQMLDIFKQNDIEATFFWIGKSLEASPDIARRVVAEGHAIGNHTWHHPYDPMDAATAASEIDRTAKLIYETTGVKTTYFRPPGGVLTNGLAKYAKEQNYSVVMWSVTSADTDPRAQPEAFVENVLKNAKPGAIVLMHDGGGDRSRTIKALPEMIAGLKQQGYRFVTIPELLEMQGQSAA
ncbi:MULTISPECIES: polysaccharide deacetylase family protein [unclassified Microcoleus]|uniref:polysaccharide deacetylase family protein n=1 Tax=unclassified Microcoleus TaxID=2642155 RepID=UPI0025FA49AE|nr:MULTISPECIES: polysaccharide deacetylase family protein [unclassified Microcoleus]